MLRLRLYCLLFSLAGNTLVSAQVYNYLPVSYSDPETNPSITTSDRYNNYISLQHQNSFSSVNPLSISRFSYAKNLEKIFCGTAITIANTNDRNHIYRHAALSFAYRNVLFNSVYLRVGASYKLIQLHSLSGTFDYFSFLPSVSTEQKKFTSNLNLNLAVASSYERYYFSFSALNFFASNQNDSLSLFPKYYLLQAGNLVSLFGGKKNNSEISFQLLNKQNQAENQNSFFMNLYWDKALSRKWSLLIGGRTGMSKNSFYQFIPTLSLYSKKLMASVQYSFFITDNDLPMVFPSSFQMNLNFKL